MSYLEMDNSLGKWSSTGEIVASHKSSTWHDEITHAPNHMGAAWMQLRGYFNKYRLQVYHMQ